MGKWKRRRPALGTVAAFSQFSAAGEPAPPLSSASTSGGATSTPGGASATSASIPQVSQSVAPADFDRTAHSTSDPASIWVIVNRTHPLHDRQYRPSDLVAVPLPAAAGHPQLRAVASAALVRLFADFHSQTGKSMQVQSAFRSYEDQARTYTTFVKRLGQTKADETTALPGDSEHQTGLAVDISAPHSGCSARECFAGTTQGRWLAANSWRYGFILRYPDGLQSVTGYSAESWHFRYVGTTLAVELHDTGIRTLEQFFATAKR